jgi:hypothetical protein
MNNKPYRYCVTDINELQDSGLIVIQEPATVLMAEVIPCGTSLDSIAQVMLALAENLDVQKFWIESTGQGRMIANYLRYYGISVKMV